MHNTSVQISLARKVIRYTFCLAANSLNGRARVYIEYAQPNAILQNKRTRTQNFSLGFAGVWIEFSANANWRNVVHVKRIFCLEAQHMQENVISLFIQST